MDGMIRRRAARVVFLLGVVALLAPACQRAASPPAVSPANVEDFLTSDPKTVGATGRPQLLEFFTPT